MVYIAVGIYVHQFCFRREVADFSNDVAGSRTCCYAIINDDVASAASVAFDQVRTVAGFVSKLVRLSHHNHIFTKGGGKHGAEHEPACASERQRIEIQILPLKLLHGGIDVLLEN